MRSFWNIFKGSKLLEDDILKVNEILYDLSEYVVLISKLYRLSKNQSTYYLNPKTENRLIYLIKLFRLVKMKFFQLIDIYESLNEDGIEGNDSLEVILKLLIEIDLKLKPSKNKITSNLFEPLVAGKFLRDESFVINDLFHEVDNIVRLLNRHFSVTNAELKHAKLLLKELRNPSVLSYVVPGDKKPSSCLFVMSSRSKSEIIKTLEPFLLNAISDIVPRNHSRFILHRDGFDVPHLNILIKDVNVPLGSKHKNPNIHVVPKEYLSEFNFFVEKNSGKIQKAA